MDMLSAVQSRMGRGRVKSFSAKRSISNSSSSYQYMKNE